MEARFSSPLIFYRDNIREKRCSVKNEKEHYEAAKCLAKYFSDRFNLAGEPKSMILSARIKDLTTEVSKVQGCENISKQEVGCILMTALELSGLRKEEDYWKTASGGITYYHIILSNRNLGLLRSIL